MELDSAKEQGLSLGRTMYRYELAWIATGIVVSFLVKAPRKYSPSKTVSKFQQLFMLNIVMKITQTREKAHYSSDIPIILRTQKSFMSTYIF